MKKQHQYYEQHLITKTELCKGCTHENHYNTNKKTHFQKVDKAIKTHTKSQMLMKMDTNINPETMIKKNIKNKNE